jgi:exonuclease VII small subunit
MRKKGEKGLADFAFHCLKHPQLSLIKTVHKIDEGRVEMTPQEYKARGVLMVTQAINFSRGSESISECREKFEEARKRFLPAYGDDKELYDQVSKHLEAVILKVNLIDTMKTKFFDRQSGAYNLECQFSEVLKFEDNLVKFFGLVVWDTFLIDEFHEIIGLVEEMFQGTPYEIRFGELCLEIGQRHESWLRKIRK